jgi:hypothetical protein
MNENPSSAPVPEGHDPSMQPSGPWWADEANGPQAETPSAPASQTRTRRSLGAKSAAAVVAVGALAVGGLAVTAAAADDATPSPSASDGATDSGTQSGDRPGRGPGGHHGPGMGGPGGPAVHGELVVETEDGVYATVLVQQGDVTAVSATSITVKSADGFSKTYAVSADSEIHVDGADAAIGDVKVGDTVGVRATVSGSTATVDHLMAGDPPARGEGRGPRGPAAESDASPSATATTSTSA